MNFKCFVVFKKTCIILGGRRCKTFTPVFDPNQDRTEQTLPNFDNNTMLCWQLLLILFFFNKMCPAQTVRMTITNKVWLWILYLYDAAASRCCLHCLQQDGVWIRSTATNTGKDDSAAPAPGHSGRNAVRRTVGVSISFRHDVVKEEKKNLL